MAPGVGEDLRRRPALHQLPHEEERRAVGRPGRLLGVVGHQHNGVVCFQLQQRLCISRLVAVEPEVLLMDEPCSALDPIATGHIEELMRQLADQYTIVIVTHNLQQAARVSRETGFMLLGELVEFGPTQALFTTPTDQRTEDYVTGRYG